jgi:flavodoxin
MLDSIMKAIVVYGTGSGNTELVSQMVAAGLEDKGMEVECVRVEKTSVEEVIKADLIVLASSTWNVGELQDYFVPFHKELIEQQLPGKPMAVIGLGDSKNYDIFNGASDILEAAVKKVGGLQLLPTMRIDGPPHKVLDQMRGWGWTLADEFWKLNPRPSQTA